MKKLFVGACALLALPGAALAQHSGGAAAHGGGASPRGGAAAHAGAGGLHGASPGFRGEAGFRGGFGGSRTPFAAGPIGRFGARDFGAWRGGFWWHGFRGGRIGWWWFADGFWYWYDNPLYPYPDYVGDYYVPSDAYAPPGQVWYYCNYPAGYYPYVHACPSGWRVVPAEPGPDGPP